MNRHHLQAGDGLSVEDRNIARAVWNHRLLFLGCVVVVGVVGTVVASMRVPQYVAEAGLLVEDPQPAALTEFQAGRNEDDVRYVADQVAILRSSAVAERASELVPNFDPRDVRRDLSIRSSEDSNYIVVRFQASNPETAAGGANAVVRAYRELIRANLDADVAGVLERLDVAIEDVSERLAATADGGMSGSTEDLLTTAEAEILAIASEIVGIRNGENVSGDVTATLRQLEAELSAWTVLANSEAQTPGAVLRRSEREDVGALLSSLRSQRARVQVESELAGDGVALFSAAERGKGEGIPSFAATAISLLLGGLIGVGVAYGLDARKRILPNRLAAEALLNVSALVEIPDDSVSSKLPVLDAKESASAEAFRFLAFGLGTRCGFSADRSGDASNCSVAFVCASTGDGGSAAAANTALAAAQQGKRVLLVDADVQGGLTQLLLARNLEKSAGTEASLLGFADTARNGIPGAKLYRLLETDGGGSLSLLGPITTSADASATFRAEEIQPTLDLVRDQFDLILADLPPILDLPDTGSLLQLTGAVVVVVPHQSEATRLERLADRLDLLGVTPIGYIYLRSQTRRWAVWRSLFGWSPGFAKTADRQRAHDGFESASESPVSEFDGEELHDAGARPNSSATDKDYVAQKVRAWTAPSNPE